MFTWWSLNVNGADVEAVRKLSEGIGQVRTPSDCSQPELEVEHTPGASRESEQPLKERAPGGSSDV